MRVAFTLEEETLSHFLFTTMGKRALLGAAGVLAVIGVYYLYQQYPAQPEQKPEAAHTPQSPEQTSPIPFSQPAAQQNDVDSTHTMPRLKKQQPSSPHTDPSIQERASPNNFSQRGKAPQAHSEFFHVKPPVTSAHSTLDPTDQTLVLVQHGSGDDIMQADGVTQASYIKPPSP